MTISADTYADHSDVLQILDIKCIIVDRYEGEFYVYLINFHFLQKKIFFPISLNNHFQKIFHEKERLVCLYVSSLLCA